MRVAVVHNRSTHGVIRHFGRPCSEKYGERTIEAVASALHAAGHEVATVEGDKHLLRVLDSFLGGAADGIVFNLAYGIQGDCRYTHVPAMLEMAGVPYTGSGPLGHALALDKVITKQLIAAAGVATPAFTVMHTPGQSPRSLRFPLVVKPRHESTSFGLRLVSTRAELDRAVEAIVTEYRQEALVEEYIDGREVCVALLGNDPLDVLPIVEQDFGIRETRIVTGDDKRHLGGETIEKICPVHLGSVLEAEVQAMSIATFRAVHCRDYARVDLRIDYEGNAWVLEINSMASLGATASYVVAAAAAGYSYAALVNQILEVARARVAVESAAAPA
jgi:D-alanine-D-alanine ligase